MCYRGKEEKKCGSQVDMTLFSGEYKNEGKLINLTFARQSFHLWWQEK